MTHQGKYSALYFTYVGTPYGAHWIASVFKCCYVIAGLFSKLELMFHSSVYCPLMVPHT